MLPELKTHLIGMLIIIGIITWWTLLYKHDAKRDQQQVQQIQSSINHIQVRTTLTEHFNDPNKLTMILNNKTTVPASNHDGIVINNQRFYYILQPYSVDPLSRGTVKQNNIIIVDTFNYNNKNITIYFIKPK